MATSAWMEKIEFTDLNGDEIYYKTTRGSQGKEGRNTSAINNYDISIYAMFFRNVLFTSMSPWPSRMNTYFSRLG